MLTYSGGVPGGDCEENGASQFCVSAAGSCGEKNGMGGLYKSFKDKTGVKRPYLVFCSEGKALVLDVTVRFELNANVLKKACHDKQKHYKSIVKQVEDSMGVTEVEIHGFPIGARGLWYRPNSKVLRKLGLSKPEARALAERLCKGALHGSLSVMREFLLCKE